VVGGAEVVQLCSGNYLGLADHPRVRQAAAEAAERYGAGAGASPAGAGRMELHGRLERALADFIGAEAALLAGSGYIAGSAAVTGLAGREAIVFSDERNGPGLADGCRISRAETFVYRHCDADHLARGLAQAGDRPKLIVTEGVFAIDGDVAPIAQLVELARGHRSLLCVDEGDGLGAIGPAGRGAVAEAGLDGEVDVIVGTLGKALGSYGGYACAREELLELIAGAARPVAFSTALPPAAVAAALASLGLLSSQPGAVEHLRRNAAGLRQVLLEHGLDTGPSRSQIVPVIVGDARRTATLSDRALEGGVLAQAIQPPAVPEGGSLLRLTAMANHRGDELYAAAGVIAAAARELGILDSPAQPPAIEDLERAA